MWESWVDMGERGNAALALEEGKRKRRERLDVAPEPSIVHVHPLSSASPFSTLAQEWGAGRRLGKWKRFSFHRLLASSPVSLISSRFISSRRPKTPLRHPSFPELLCSDRRLSLDLTQMRRKFLDDDGVQMADSAEHREDSPVHLLHSDATHGEELVRLTGVNHPRKVEEVVKTVKEGRDGVGSKEAPDAVGGKLAQDEHDLAHLDDDDLAASDEESVVAREEPGTLTPAEDAIDVLRLLRPVVG